MRGAQLFNNTFKHTNTQKAERKRSADLIEKRNKCMIARFYFLGQFTDKRYEAIIQQLSDEFYLKLVTVPRVIIKNEFLLKEIKKANPQKSFFRKTWPSMNWDL